MTSTTSHNSSSSSSNTNNDTDPPGDEGGSTPAVMPVEDTALTNGNNSIWGGGQGYTPMAAWAESGGSNGLFSLGPGEDKDDNDDNNESEANVFGGGGTFFANLQAFTAAAASQSEDGIDGYQAVAVTAKPSTNNEEPDFLNLADQALLALEDDYRLTLQGENSGTSSLFPRENPSSKDERLLSTPAAVAEDKTLPAVFAADWDVARTQREQEQSLATEKHIPDFADFTQPYKQLPDIDTDKVRQAVQSLELRRPAFRRVWQQWERQQQRQAAIAPLYHPNIPDDVCLLFRNGDVANAETQRLSRAATLAHALRRLDLPALAKDDDPLVLHLLGCDHVEAANPSQLKNTFTPLVDWWRNHTRKPPRRVELHLIGPSMPLILSSLELVLDPDESRRLESVQVSCHTGYYHEWRLQQRLQQDAKPPDLLVAFHAGLWGYDTWKPTLDWLVEQEGPQLPLLVTSYTLLEAEEDQEVLQNLLPNQSIWTAEYNPFATQQIRPTATAVEGEDYRENAAWQAWWI
jgi:hypothetical protein